jgi:hypothetical protein
MEFKYKTIFSSTLKPLVSEEKDKYLALASRKDIGEFLPDIDTKQNVDLLPIAFNAAVANRVNKNGDVISTKTALDIYKNFINKPINIEHNRQKVIGTILTAGFSEFGTDKPLTEKDLENHAGPFNLTLGGVIWKLVNSDLSALIEESADPTSEEYMRISASWELGFNEYNLILLEGDEKNIENGEIIDDEQEIEELEGFLKGLGGEGKLKNGKFVYRQVINDVVPLGIGLTEAPAADVQGIVAENKSEKLEAETSEPTEENLPEYGNGKQEEASKTIENKSSQNGENIVNKERNHYNLDRPIMKITNIKEITDESMQTLSASAIHDFIRESLETASEEWVEKKQETEKKLAEAEEAHTTLVSNHDAVKAEVDDLKTKLDKLEQETLEREAQEKFIQRMATLDEVYDLNDEDRKVLATQIKDLNEEAFEAYSSNMSVLLREKSREVIKAAAEETAKAQAETEAEKPKEEAIASEETQEVQKAVEEAVDNAEQDENTVPVNTTASEEETVLEKYQRAFTLDQFEVKL